MFCRACGASLSPDAPFCRSCGSWVDATDDCPACGAARSASSRFCASCGAPFHLPTSAARGASGSPSPSTPPARRETAAASTGLSRSSAEALDRNYRPGSAAHTAQKRATGFKLAAALPVVLVATAVIVGAGYLALDGAHRLMGDAPDHAAAQLGRLREAAGSLAAPVATPRALPQGPVLGAATFEPADPSGSIQTNDWGPVPPDQIGVVLKDGFGRTEAEALAGALSGKIVGELDYIDLYQIETPGASEADLRAALGAAKAARSVELAFPMQQAFLDADVRGQQCGPLSDPLYGGDNAIPYRMIGMQEAWDLVRAAGVDLHPVQVGVTDDGLYRKTGEFDGNVKVEAGGDDELARATGSGGQDDPFGSHGTAVAGIIGADPDNGGMTGVAAVLGDRLSIAMTNVFGTTYGRNRRVAARPDDPTRVETGGVTYAIGALVAMKRQIEGGATIINGSWGNSKAHPELARAYRLFFEKMGKEHPQVLFVFSAGNDGRALDGSRRYPSGAPLPNVITVGNVANDGSNTVGSNVAGKDFEVTLAAPGERVVSGVGADGTVSNDLGGTSFATPQVTAAAAILRSVDPGLAAGEIKKLLVETASTEVDTGGKVVKIDASLGGRVLRVDNAVFRAINDLRRQKGLKPLERDFLRGVATVDLIASEGRPMQFNVKGGLPAVGEKGADLTISLQGQHAIGGQTTRHLDRPGEVVWDVSLLDPSGSGVAKVTRSDSKACATVVLRSAPPAATPTAAGSASVDAQPPSPTVDGDLLKGTWKGTMTLSRAVDRGWFEQTGLSQRLETGKPLPLALAIYPSSDTGGELQQEEGYPLRIHAPYHIVDGLIVADRTAKKESATQLGSYWEERIHLEARVGRAADGYVLEGAFSTYWVQGRQAGKPDEQLDVAGSFRLTLEP